MIWNLQSKGQLYMCHNSFLGGWIYFRLANRCQSFFPAVQLTGHMCAVSVLIYCILSQNETKTKLNALLPAILLFFQLLTKALD